MSAGYQNMQFIMVFPMENSTAANLTESAESAEYSTPASAVPPTKSLLKFKNNLIVIEESADQPLDFISEGCTMVFDQCARLTYVLCHPFNTIQRPFLKASILSTIYDAPCDKCEVSVLFKVEKNCVTKNPFFTD